MEFSSQLRRMKRRILSLALKVDREIGSAISGHGRGVNHPAVQSKDCAGGRDLLNGGCVCDRSGDIVRSQREIARRRLNGRPRVQRSVKGRQDCCRHAATGKGSAKSRAQDRFADAHGSPHSPSPGFGEPRKTGGGSRIRRPLQILPDCVHLSQCSPWSARTRRRSRRH